MVGFHCTWNFFERKSEQLLFNRYIYARLKYTHVVFLSPKHYGTAHMHNKWTAQLSRPNFFEKQISVSVNL